MTRRAYPVEAIRAAEAPLIEAAEAAGDPDAVMRRAAAGVAHHTAAVLRKRTGGLYGRTVLLGVGAGDNGGDALYAGALLRWRGCRVDAVLLDPDRAHPRGLAALRRAGGRIHAAEAAEAVESVGAHARPVPDVAIDGVVGLGGRGPLRSPADRIVAELAAAGVPWVAVDLPSGIDADTGTVHDTHVPATLTVTFGALRRAHLLASPECGRVELVDIGMDEPGLSAARPQSLSSPGRAEVGRDWPVPGPDDDKYSQGVVALRAGSQQYPGAAVLAVTAAVVASSGLTRYVGSGSGPVLASRPEVVCHPTVAEAGRAQAWVVGPGAGTGTEAIDDITAILERGVPTLLDADALSVLADHPVLLRGATAPVLLTPHAGEFARLAGGRDRADRAGALRRYVAGLRDRGIDATVLLKGRVTLIDNGEDCWAIDAGSSWAATAGSGDVLAGITGALLASGHSPAWAAASAVIAHSEAARLAAHRAGPGPGAPIGASDLLDALPAAIAGLRAAGV